MNPILITAITAGVMGASYCAYRLFTQPHPSPDFDEPDEWQQPQRQRVSSPPPPRSEASSSSSPSSYSPPAVDSSLPIAMAMMGSDSSPSHSDHGSVPSNDHCSSSTYSESSSYDSGSSYSDCGSCDSGSTSCD